MLEFDADIPLFPLNVVLFPGMMLPLHIFEERYKSMIKECIATGQTFGVVLAKNKQAQAPNVGGLFRDDLYEVGTTARITAVENLQDGRMNLITVGHERFVIRDIYPSAADFLRGRVDPYPLETENSAEVSGLVKKLRPMVRQYINHLADASGEDLSNATLPNDAMALAFLAGTALQGPLTDKQKLLSARSLRTLITNAVSVLDKEDQILVYMIAAYSAHQRVERLPFVDYSLN
ncbi:MAG: LON peptidase substrate-binding domain-containing protein [Anaerolineales bacterium]|nr:LON peptidase substrate-binding domain-containing protein [Anaerolineales bacterium]